MYEEDKKENKQTGEKSSEIPKDKTQESSEYNNMPVTEDGQKVDDKLPVSESTPQISDSASKSESAEQKEAKNTPGIECGHSENENIVKDKNVKSAETGTTQTDGSAELTPIPSATGEHSGQKSGTGQTSESEDGQKAKNENVANQVTDINNTTTTPQGSDSGSQVADSALKNAIENPETPAPGQPSAPVTTDVPAGQKQ